jgi:enoyl-CoA hydratase/carnithine racemase
MTDGLSLQNLLLERDGAIAVVIVNRPEVLNALNIETLGELRRTMTSLGDDSGIRCIILT